MVTKKVKMCFKMPDSARSSWSAAIFYLLFAVPSRGHSDYSHYLTRDRRACPKKGFVLYLSYVYASGQRVYSELHYVSSTLLSFLMPSRCLISPLICVYSTYTQIYEYEYTYSPTSTVVRKRRKNLAASPSPSSTLNPFADRCISAFRPLPPHWYTYRGASITIYYVARPRTDLDIKMEYEIIFHYFPTQPTFACKRVRYTLDFVCVLCNVHRLVGVVIRPTAARMGVEVIFFLPWILYFSLGRLGRYV